MMVECTGAECLHEWVAIWTPMEMGKAIRVLRRLRCPSCGAGSKKINVRQEADGVE